MSSLLVADDEPKSGEQEKNSQSSQSVLPPEKPPKKPRSPKQEKSEGRTPTEQLPFSDRSPKIDLDYLKILDILAKLDDRLKVLELKGIEGKIPLTSLERTVLAKIFKAYTLQYRRKNLDRINELLTLLKSLGIEAEYKKAMDEVDD